jgi:hypothetical protein
MSGGGEGGFFSCIKEGYCNSGKQIETNVIGNSQVPHLASDFL